MHFCVLLSLTLLSGAAAFVPMAARAPTMQRRASAVMIASTPEEKALLLASKKVTAVAAKFGTAQGKAAQAWVEKAVAEKSMAGEKLVEMELELFGECSVDDESGRCKALGEAIDAMKIAVEERTPSEPMAVLTAKTPIQEAATAVRQAAMQFGPEQTDAANAWIKQVVLGVESKAVTAGFRESLLEQKITLFGECLLSEDGTPSDCEQLEIALAALQESIELSKGVVSWYDEGVRINTESETVVGSVVPTATPEPRLLGSRRLKRWLTRA